MLNRCECCYAEADKYRLYDSVQLWVSNLQRYEFCDDCEARGCDPEEPRCEDINREQEGR